MTTANVMQEAQSPAMPKRRGHALIPHECNTCHKPLSPNPGEKPSHFNRRQYCDKRCYLADPHKPGGRPLNYASHRSIAAKLAPSDTKLCPVCAKAFRRRPGTSQSDWAKVRCCSRPCAARLPMPKHAKSTSGQAARDLSWRIAMEVRRIQRIARAPRTTFESAEEAIRRGVPVTRCPPAYAVTSDHLPNGSPARPATGRRRSAS